MSGLINSLFGSGPDYPEPPNPAMVSGVQGKADLEAYLRMLEDSRTNTVTPWGTQTWDQSTNFDQAGFDKALAEWQAASGGSQGEVDWLKYSKDNPDIIGSGMTPQEHYERYGKAEGRPLSYVANGVSQPNRADYTTEQWTLRQTLSPDQQALFDANIASQKQQAGLLAGAGDRVTDSLSGSIDWSSLPGLTGSVDAANLFQFDPQDPGILGDLQKGLAGLDPEEYNQRVADAQYNMAARYRDPEVERQQKALEARLAEQGFVPGTPGYAQAMETFQDTNNRASADARDRATLLGAQVGSQQFGNSLNSLQAQIAAAMGGAGFNNSAALAQQNANTNAATFGNTARTQAIAELLLRRNQPLNELNALRTGTQVTMPNNPATYSTPNLQSPNWTGNINSAYQGQVANVGAETAFNNNQANAWTNLIGGAMGAPAGTFSGWKNPFASAQNGWASTVGMNQ